MKPPIEILLIRLVAEYHAVFSLPIPFKILSSKFAKRTPHGLDALLYTLQEKGLIRLWLNRRGGKAISLTHLTYEPPPREAWSEIPLKPS